MIFGGAECLTSNERFDFGADPDQDSDTEILREFLPLRNSKFKNVASKSINNHYNTQRMSCTCWWSFAVF